jgi:uncharacterized protein YndB with AHSA1/START domain
MSGGGSSDGKTRRLPIPRWTDIAAPIDVVWDRWTEFEDFPKFMHRVLSVKKEERNKLSWEEKIWFSRRQWEGEITERRKNERIAWKTTSGTSHSGLVTFHKLDTKLTRVMVDMDFRPSGMIEKMASGMRFVKHAVRSDLARLKACVEPARGRRCSSTFCERALLVVFVSRRLARALEAADEARHDVLANDVRTILREVLARLTGGVLEHRNERVAG